MLIDQNAYYKIIENLHDGLYFVDQRRVITYWNKAAEKITGFKAEEVIGHSCADNILTHISCHGENLCTGICPLAKTMVDGLQREVEVYLHHKDGHRIPISIRVSTLTNDDGEVIGGIELFTDLSSSEANNLRIKELEKLAFLDYLTRLANRSYLTREIQGRFEEYQRLNIPFGILFMDIDHFKRFNDQYGHDIGDEVLKVVANTLMVNTRPFDLYGRWGGEEFLGVIRNITPTQLEHLGNRLRILIEKSYLMNHDQKLQITISIGATLILPEDDMDSIVNRADQLLYQSKDKGRNCLTIG